MIYNYRCPQCGNIVASDKDSGEIKCSYCGCQFSSKFQGAPNYQTPQQRDIFTAGPSGKCRGAAGLLAIFLGSLGIHYFYMEKKSAGITCLLITLLSCGILGTILSVVTLVQGILILCMSEEEFENRYIHSDATFPF